MINQSHAEADKSLRAFANEVILLSKKHNVQILMFVNYAYDSKELNKQQVVQNAYMVGPSYIGMVLIKNLYAKVMDSLSLSILKEHGPSPFMQPAPAEELIN